MQAPGHAERRRASARRTRAWRLAVPCAASLVLNAAALAAFAALGVMLPPARSGWVPVAVAPLRASEWEANRTVEPPPAIVAAADPRPVPKRIIELPPDAARDPLRHPRPPARDARHLAERDQTVDEEAVSRDAGPTERLLRVPQLAAPGREGSGEHGAHRLALRGQEGPRGGGGDPAAEPGPDPAPQVSDAGIVPIAVTQPERPAALPPIESSLPLAGAEGGQRIQGRRVSGEPLRSLPVPGGAPNWDGVEEAREGDETRLDANRFEPAAYWADVRARIQSQWQERAQATIHRYDPGEDGYFYVPRRILLRLALDASGRVRNVEILESSRIAFFDAVALAAVEELQPYPEPPPRALDADGAAKINVRFVWYPSLRHRGQ